jgi:hypothetical protein
MAFPWEGGSGGVDRVPMQRAVLLDPTAVLGVRAELRVPVRKKPIHVVFHHYPGWDRDGQADLLITGTQQELIRGDLQLLFRDLPPPDLVSGRPWFGLKAVHFPANYELQVYCDFYHSSWGSQWHTDGLWPRRRLLRWSFCLQPHFVLLPFGQFEPVGVAHNPLPGFRVITEREKWLFWADSIQESQSHARDLYVGPHPEEAEPDLEPRAGPLPVAYELM